MQSLKAKHIRQVKALIRKTKAALREAEDILAELESQSDE